MLVFDNFNRANNTDLNAESTETGGNLAPYAWEENSRKGSPEIVNNKLQLGETSAADGWSIAWVDYNFAYDSQVINAGEFTVSVDIFNLGSTGGTRFSGFGVGNAITDLATWSANTPNNFTSDFFIGYDPTGTAEVKIFHGGTEAYQQTINLNSGANLSVRFYGFSDFNAGTSVSYEASINESIVTTGTFAWSDTNENHINLYSNYTNHRAQFDDFEISTVPEPRSYALLLGSLALGIACWRSKQKAN